MKRKILLPLVAVMMVAGLVVGCAAPAPAPAPAPTPAPAPAPTVEPITLKAVISMPYRPGGRGQEFVDFCERLTERAKGELIIDFKGGAEVIPAFDQFEAIRSGVVDMGWLFSGAYQRLVPEVVSYPCSALSKMEERELGYHDFLIERHKEQGMYYIGRLGGDGFVWQSNVLITEPYSGFQGLKFAVIGSMWVSFAEKLGIVPVFMPPHEIYTALERGIVVGAGAAAWGSAALGWGEVTKYQIDHAFWETGGSTSLIRLEAWNNLPKHLQDLIKAEQINTEGLLGLFFEDKLKEERKRLAEQGMEFITFSPKDAEWYLEMSKEAKWEELMEMAPESYPIIREMLRK